MRSPPECNHGCIGTGPTQSFHNPTGAIVPLEGTGDSLGGPTTVTSPPKSDTTPKTNQSQHDTAPKTDQSQQSQQDSSLSPNIVPDASGNVASDSNVPDQVPDAQSNQDSNDQTKDDGDHDGDPTPLKIGNHGDHSWICSFFHKCHPKRVVWTQKS